MGASFESSFAKARTIRFIWAHRDGRVIALEGIGTEFKLSPAIFAALVRNELFTKVGKLEEGVDIYEPVKKHPLYEALLGDEDPFEGQ